MLARGPAPQVSHLLTKSAASGVFGRRHARDTLGITENVIGHRHAADDVLQTQDVVAVQHLADRRLHVRRALPHDLLLLRVAGIIDLDEEQEAIELGFGQRIGAFLLDGVLRGQHEERDRASDNPTPPMETLRSCMASSRAACVFGGVRLISSASRMLANTGPGKNLNMRCLLTGSS